MGLGATDLIRLLMRKSTFDRIRLSLAAFVREVDAVDRTPEWSIRSGRIRDAQRCVRGAVTDWAMPGSHRREEIS